MTWTSQSNGTPSPRYFRDLSQSEQRFVRMLQELQFGRLEAVEIRAGELVLSPWPRMIRTIKFRDRSAGSPTYGLDFELKVQAREFINYVRSVSTGQIRILHIQDGLPAGMEIEELPDMEVKAHV